MSADKQQHSQETVSKRGNLRAEDLRQDLGRNLNGSDLSSDLEPQTSAVLSASADRKRASDSARQTAVRQTSTKQTVGQKTKPRRINQNAESVTSSKAALTLRYVLLLLSLIFVLIPVYVLLVTSFKGVADADPCLRQDKPD